MVLPRMPLCRNVIAEVIRYEYRARCVATFPAVSRAGGWEDQPAPDREASRMLRHLGISPWGTSSTVSA
jgi:hypothetical protein